jgi:hypothetical protein
MGWGFCPFFALLSLKNLLNVQLLTSMHHPTSIPALSPKFRGKFGFSLLATVLVGLAANAALATPNGTWLSKPQLMFHLSNGTLNLAMERIRSQQFRVVFLDFRHVSSQAQQEVAQAARNYQLLPIVWVQSPQFRSLSVQQLIAEGQYADGIQVDDHYFAHYSRTAFYQLRSQYPKLIFCSIQPFQAALLPPTGCNQQDVQCYVPGTFKQCMGLADRLKAVTSLSAENTYNYRQRMGGRSFNVFLWPYSNDFVARQPAPAVEAATSWGSSLFRNLTQPVPRNPIRWRQLQEDNGSY